MPAHSTLLTIAGFDPGSGAGITADLAVMTAHGFFGTSAITALTVQSTLGVRATYPVEASILRSTLDCLTDDLPAAGVKLGMLATARNVETVGQFLAERCRETPLVVDPVLRASSGTQLLEPAGVLALEHLFENRAAAQADTWITPNLDELAMFAGCAVRTKREVEDAAAKLRSRWPHMGVIATGGHLHSPEDLVQAAGKPAVWLSGSRIESRATHGTGCAFSTAFLCGLVAGLANGADALDAARAAKHFVEEGIRRAEPRGAGRGPLDLVWPLRQNATGADR